MTAQVFFFYLFALIAVLSALRVIVARNPVHSVLFLILTFVAIAGEFVLLGAEFLAMMLVVVYVGAVAVLFLFVIMLLDVDFVKLKQGFVRYLPFAAGIAALLGSELVYASWGLRTVVVPASAVSNTKALGLVIYTRYAYIFELSGFVLLTAMIGAIVLTLRHKEDVKRQNIAAQNARTPATSVELRKVASRAGL